MTTPKKQRPGLSASSAAARLAEALGGKPEHWTSWLKNDRRPGRAHSIPVEPGPGRPRYSLENIERFIADQAATRPAVAERAAVGAGELAPLLRMAVMLDDAELRDELDRAHLEGEAVDLVAFEVLSGLDQHNQPTIWIRSGLRAGMHYAITLPFTAAEVLERAEVQQW